MPGNLVRPNLRTLQQWITEANIADDAITIPKFADLADQGILGRGADGAGPVELLIPSANGQILKRSSDVVGFSALDATDWTPLLLAVNAWASRQTFNVGATFLPGAAPASPVEGLLDYIAGQGLSIFNGTAFRPLMQEGTWTPSLRPDTVGDFAATYSTQTGGFLKIGKLVIAWLNLVTSSMTFTTASGAMRILGLPFASATSPAESIPGLMQTLFGTQLLTTAGVMEPKLAPSGAGATTAVFRQTVRAATTTTGNLAAGVNVGFANNQNVTLQGGFLYFTNEA